MIILELLFTTILVATFSGCTIRFGVIKVPVLREYEIEICKNPDNLLVEQSDSTAVQSLVIFATNLANAIKSRNLNQILEYFPNDYREGNKYTQVFEFFHNRLFSDNGEFRFIYDYDCIPPLYEKPLAIEGNLIFFSPLAPKPPSLQIFGKSIITWPQSPIKLTLVKLSNETNKLDEYYQIFELEFKKKNKKYSN